MLAGREVAALPQQRRRSGAGLGAGGRDAPWRGWKVRGSGRGRPGRPQPSGGIAGIARGGQCSGFVVLRARLGGGGSCGPGAAFPSLGAPGAARPRRAIAQGSAAGRASVVGERRRVAVGPGGLGVPAGGAALCPRLRFAAAARRAGWAVPPSAWCSGLGARGRCRGEAVPASLLLLTEDEVMVQP